MEGLVPWDLLVKDVPAEYHHDLDYIIGMLDWDANVDPEFGKHNLYHPRPVGDDAAMADAGYSEKWVVYSTPLYSAKELTVLPEAETPTIIRYGQMTRDEMFVTADAARAGVTIRNASDKDNLVMLKHFGPGNPDAAPLVTRSYGKKKKAKKK